MTDLQTSTPLLDAFSEVVARHPDKVFVETPEKALTIREVDRLGNRVARAVLVSPDRLPVAVLCEDAVDFQVAQIGALKSGRPFLRIHTDEPAARVAAVFEQTGVDTLIVSAGQEVDPAFSGLGVISMPDLPADDAPVAIDVRPDDPAMLMHTSGSTGVPKGIIHSYSSLLWRSVGFVRALDLTSDDRILLLSRLGTLELGAALLTGASLHPFDVRGRGMAGLASWLRDSRVTVFRSPPSVMRSLVADVGDLGFPDLRVLIQAGETLTAGDVAMIRSILEPDTALLHFYGTSESGVVTAEFVDGSFDANAGAMTIGTPAPGVTVTIEDAAGTPVPHGDIGDIVVRSPALAIGYFGADDRTSGRYRGDGPARRFVTGDLGRWNERGELEFHGRDDHQVKVQGGHRVEMGEVEEAIRHLPGIDEAVVAARVGDDGTTTLVAYYTHDDPAPRVADLRRSLAERLPPYMVPARWVPMASVPRSLPTEKIDRQALPEPPPVAVRDHETVTGRMTAIWSHLLGVHEVDDGDSFFELGGDSFAAAELVMAVEDAFDCRIEMADLFGDDTFGSMVAAVEASQGVVPDGPLFALKRSGDLPPLHCIHMPGWGRLRYLVLSRAIGERRPMIGVADDDTPAVPNASSLARIADRYATAIRESSDGPYLLLGHSAGGTLAYEVARRLADAGGAVPFVGMIDSPYPGSRPPMWTRLLQAIDRHGVVGVAKIVVVRALRRVGLRTPAPVKRKVPKSVRKRLRRAHDLHRVSPAGLPVTYFRATETAQEPHHAESWRRLGATVIDVPGKHGTILKANRIAELAARLEEAIGASVGS